MGFTSPISDDLKASSDNGGVGITDDQNSLFGSIVTVGAMAGSMCGGMIADKFSRRGCVPATWITFAHIFDKMLAILVFSD